MTPFYFTEGRFVVRLIDNDIRVVYRAETSDAAREMVLRIWEAERAPDPEH